MKKDKKEYIILVLIQLLVNMATVGVALLLNALIDAAQTSIETKDLGYIANVLIISFFYAMVLGILIYISNRYKAYYIKNNILEMREGLAYGTLHSSFSDFEKNGSAAYVTAFNQNFSTIEEQVLKNRILILDSVISMACATVVLIYMNPVIALISIIMMAIPSLVPRLFNGALGRSQANIVEATTDYNDKVNDILGGYEVIRTYRATNDVLPIYYKSARNLENAKENFSVVMGALYGVTTLASVVVQFLVMGLAGYFAVNGYITIGSIVAITQLTGQVIQPAFELSAKISELKSTETIIESMRDLSEVKKDSYDLGESVKQCISLENVSLGYEQRDVLEDVTTTFYKGKKYAIIGKSGSGKSTLLKVIAGYYPQYAGNIYTDGKEGLPSEIAMIHQDTFLFNDSIRNNLTMWKSYSDEEIKNAIEKAGLSELISSLPDGIETVITENGNNFSGGECQRIAVARALLSGKSILLMDEATSALDEETARAVEGSILSLENMTCISVTHRLTDESKYDEVLTMQDGRLSRKAS